MNRSKIGIVKPIHKQILYIVSTILWLTGTVWLYIRYCLKTQGQFDFQMLRIHGAAAMGFLIIFGAILYHIKPGWRQKRQRPSGLSLIVSCIVLILTGWGLYYLGNDDWRNWTSIIHCVLGLGLPGIVFIHVLGVQRKEGNDHKKDLLQTKGEVK